MRAESREKTIGALSLVIKDINEPGVYAGNPLVKLKG